MVSRAMRVKIVCAMLLGVLLVFAGLFWYFRVYTKTPEYALRSIETALEQHDEALFQRHVRLNDVLNSGYDDFMMGTMDAEFGHSHESAAALEDFSRMLKPAFIQMLQDAVHTRLTTGEWPSTTQAEDGTDVSNLTLHEDTQTAEADILAHQDEADADFTFNLLLTPSEEGDWQVVAIQNLHEYAVLLEQARRQRIETYLAESDAIIARHKRIVDAAQLRLYSVLGAGALGSQATRDMARQIMEKDILTDWQECKDELSAVTAPRSMQSLHQLRLKICDLHIAYAQGYAAWMTDKNAATIRTAENNLRQAEVLEVEASFLEQRAKRSFGDKSE